MEHLEREAPPTPDRRLSTTSPMKTHHRGVETAKEVGAVSDGSEWCQTFVGFHRRDALRILDLTTRASTSVKPDKPFTGLADPLHHLKHEGSTSVLVDFSETRWSSN